MGKTSTSWKKGEAKGRPKGTPNKLTRSVKERVLDVFNELQNDPKANMLEWGKNNPSLFYQIAAKLIPTEIKGEVEHTGVEIIINRKPSAKTD